MPQQQSALEYLSHGQTPFFRLPVAAAPGAGPESPGSATPPPAFSHVDAVILGVPYDGGTTYQPGARFAPYHVRRVSALLQAFHPAHGIDVFDRVRAVDGGNVTAPPFDAELVRELVHARVGQVVEAGAVPFLVGGDHTIALPAMSAVAAKHGPLAVVHVDAHLDTSSGEVWGSEHHHGTPLRHALARGLIEPGQLYQIGLRSTWSGDGDGRVGDEHRARRFPMEILERSGIEGVAAEVRRCVVDRPLYLTFDIDAVDPAFAPGTGTPVPGGMSSRDAIRLLRGLAGLRLVGMDLVEVLPALDHADITSHLAAYLLYEGIALLGVSRLTAGVPGTKSPRSW
jgi:agmatinase